MKKVLTILGKWKIFFLIISVRLSSVLLVRTWYVPDEFWQSLEIAHHLAFGYGYTTWEWHEGIRNYLYPLIISILYKILEFLHLDTVLMLTVLPRIFQAIATGLSEYYLYCWCNHSKWTLFIILSSWFVFYTGSRTLLNTVEYMLTSLTITQFPWYDHKSKTNYNFLCTIGLGTVMRPTFAIPWIPLCIYHLYNTKSKLNELLFKYLPIGLTILFLSISVDSLTSGTILFTHWNFLKLNVLQDIGSFYGSHPWHWYFTVGLPTVMSITFIPFIFAVSEIIKTRYSKHVPSLMLLSIVFSLSIYSLISHKEFRFLSSILPMVLIITSKYLAQISSYERTPKLFLWAIASVIAMSNLIPIYYLGWIHQSGTTMVMPKLLNVVNNYNSIENSPQILFLMPCHSTPYYSHIHRNISMRFLTCEPDAKYNGIADEAAIFYHDPIKWLDINYPHLVVNNNCNGTHCLDTDVKLTKLPTHIVMFEGLQDQISSWLNNYKEIIKVFHTDFPEGRISSNVLIFALL